MIGNKLSSKKVILGIVLLVIIATAAVLYFSSSKKPAETVSQTKNDQPATNTNPASEETATEETKPATTDIPKTVEETTLAPTPMSEDAAKINISDWKTYTNADYGYEIKYPKNWLTYDSLYDTKGKKHPESLYIQNFSRPTEAGYSGIGGKGCQLNVWIEKGKYASIQDWINTRRTDMGPDLEKITKKEIEVGGIKGMEVTFFGNFIGTGNPTKLVLNNGIVYEINGNWQDVSQESCQPMFDRIVSTFEFAK